MELETWAQFFRQMDAHQAVYLLALIMAAREIQRLHVTQLADKETRLKQQSQRLQLLQRILKGYQRKLMRPLNHGKNKGK